MSDPVATCDETDADAGRVGLLDDADLLLSRPAPPPPRRLSRFACVGISHRDHSCPHRRIRTRGLKPSRTFVNAAGVGHGSTADAWDQGRSDVRRRYAFRRHLAEQHSASVRDALKGILHPVQRCSRRDAAAVPTVNRIQRRFEGRSAGPHAKPGAAQRAARTFKPGPSPGAGQQSQPTTQCQESRFIRSPVLVVHASGGELSRGRLPQSRSRDSPLALRAA